ncbi:putative calcineurin-like phosphoesterase [Lyophyllum shimeji]|uniref:Calcineurin-like phosphoesterase n=1 Tax=Lyophyllum shimeji TaxID=47721 RepID=A0A9P3PRS9_LYOSH|nr:putative calcineurin-like phosphoesterase [Lyophyllum shimeji]
MVGRPQPHLAMLEPPVRQLCAYAVITLFVVFFFASGLSYHFSNDDLPFLSAYTTQRFPDFSQYPDLKTLSAHQFPLDDPSRRIIIVGDIHGQYEYFSKLLEKVSYKPASDVLIHVGDIVTKGSHNGSMQVLSYMASHNTTGVRGNHDQKVVEWRAWIHWIRSQRGGPRWLQHLSDAWSAEQADSPNPEAFVESQRKKSKHSHWWKKVPKGWKLFGDHFTIARAMSDAEYEYLRALPLTIHIPNAHAYIVHAGLLPSDPTYTPDHPGQPLATVPRLPKGSERGKTQDETNRILRTLQERAILSNVPQNTVPYNVLNMRSILHGKVHKGSAGKAWSKAWKHDMKRCQGFNQELSVTKPQKELLPCYPSTVIYGHAASRGLDIKRWSIGLDSGCVYDRRLTALVLGSEDALSSSARRDDNRDLNDDDKDREEHVDEPEEDDTDTLEANQHGIPFGDSHHGKIVSVSCAR